MATSDGSDGRRNNRGNAATQFKPGEKRYRPGRPKGSRNIKTIIAEAFAKKVGVTEGGKRASYSKFELGMTHIATNFAKGGANSLGTLEMLHKRGYIEADVAAAAADLSEREKPVFADIVRRLRQTEHEVLRTIEPARLEPEQKASPPLDPQSKRAEN